jgi:Uma2 family endonuclease
MNATLTPPPAPNYPRPLVPKWTVTEFHHMAGMGWFEGRRPFLLDGVIMEQGPMSPCYATALGLGMEALRSVFGPVWTVRPQLPLAVDDHNDPFPDFAVVRGNPRDFPGVHPATAALVVEVSDTTLQLDLTEKAERYATAGVPDYWVLDLTGRELIVLRDPQPLPKGAWPGCEAERFVPPSPAGNRATAYRTRLAFRVGDHVAPLAVPTASVAVAELLP